MKSGAPNRIPEPGTVTAAGAHPIKPRARKAVHRPAVRNIDQIVTLTLACVPQDLPEIAASHFFPVPTISPGRGSGFMGSARIPGLRFALMILAILTVNTACQPPPLEPTSATSPSGSGDTGGDRLGIQRPEPSRAASAQTPSTAAASTSTSGTTSTLTPASGAKAARIIFKQASPSGVSMPLHPMAPSMQQAPATRRAAFSMPTARSWLAAVSPLPGGQSG